MIHTRIAVIGRPNVRKLRLLNSWSKSKKHGMLWKQI
nr:hypothetical protein [Tanacetum cinerariifolium]